MLEFFVANCMIVYEILVNGSDIAHSLLDQQKVFPILRPPPGVFTVSHGVVLRRVHLFVASVRLVCPWNFSGKNTGAGCHFLLPDSGVEPLTLTSPESAEGLFTTNTTSMTWPKSNCNHHPMHIQSKRKQKQIHYFLRVQEANGKGNKPYGIPLIKSTMGEDTWQNSWGA